jgi:hypothetical protein
MTQLGLFDAPVSRPPVHVVLQRRGTGPAPVNCPRLTWELYDERRAEAERMRADFARGAT